MLLDEGKATTRARDALNNDPRRELPAVEVEKHYVFERPDSHASLADLFDGRRQLTGQHFMFEPAWHEGYPSCTEASGEISDGPLMHLDGRDTTSVVISRAPRPKTYKARRGWKVPWDASYGSDFHL